MATNKILQTFGIAATPTQNTTTWSQAAQQTTILEASNVRYPRNVVLTNQGIRAYRPGVSAGILMADLIQAMLTLEPSLTWSPLITVQPPNTIGIYSNSTSFAVTATSEIAITYQWQLSTNSGTTWADVTNAGVYSGVTTATLAISSTTGLHNNQYRVKCMNGSGTTTSSAATLSVVPKITVQPANASVTHPAASSFSVTASGTATLLYQWYVSTDAGVTYSALTNAGVYTNTTTATMNISDSTGLNGYKYRVIVTDGNAQTTTSTAATLTVA